MIDLKYTLKQDELREYYETALMNDAEINKFHWKLRLFVPVGILLFLALAANTVLIWGIGIALIVLWIIIADTVLFKKYKKVLIGKYTDPDKLKLSEMHVVLSGKNIFVNGIEQKVYDYALFEHMIVIIFQNKTNILVPERVFNNEEERKIASKISKRLNLNFCFIESNNYHNKKATSNTINNDQYKDYDINDNIYIKKKDENANEVTEEEQKEYANYNGYNERLIDENVKNIVFRKNNNSNKD